MKPVVETTVGDQKPWPDCIVTRTQKRAVQPPPDSSGSVTNEMLVSLNCEASPQGKTTAASAKSGG